MSVFSRLARLAGRCAFVLSVLLALAWLGVQFWVVPNLDRWRADVAESASESTGLDVRIGRLSGGWSGWHPQFSAYDVTVAAPSASHAAVVVPRVDATVRWRSLPAWKVLFDRLTVEGADATIDRGVDGELSVAGLSLGLDKPDAGVPLAERPWVQWVRQQQEISLQDATVRWRDHRRNAPELVVSDISLNVSNEQSHQDVTLHASPPAALAGPVTGRARLQATWFDPQAMGDGGQVQVDVANVVVDAWTPWLPDLGGSGAADLNGSVVLRAGTVGDAQVELNGRNLAWQGPQGRIAAANTTLRWAGPLLDHSPTWKSERSARHATLSAEMQNLVIEATGGEAIGRWQADSAAWTAGITSAGDGALSVRVPDAVLTDSRTTLRAAGTWRSDDQDPLGVINMRVTADPLPVADVAAYLPDDLSAPLRRWLKHALVAGEARHTQMTLAGALSDFPFTSRPGTFNVKTELHDVTLDFLPAQAGGGPGRPWPALRNVNGVLEVAGTSLTVAVDPGASLGVRGSRSVGVNRVLAHIEDMLSLPTLALDGVTQGRVEDYLSVVDRSALRGLLDGMLSQARGTGQVEMPLTLSVPLEGDGPTAVRGDVRLKNVDMSPGFDVPRITGASGRLVFTRDSLRAVGLTGRWLGGSVAASGTLSSQRRGVATGVQVTGRASIDAMRDAFGWTAPVFNRMSGAANYRGRIAYADLPGQPLTLSLDSDLAGIALDMPAPLGKAAGDVSALSATWTGAVDTRGQGAMLAARLGEDVLALMQRSASPSDHAPFFARGGVAIGRPVTLPVAGLRVDASWAEADTAAWRDFVHDIIDEPTTTNDAPVDTAAVDTAPVDTAAVDTAAVDTAAVNNARVDRSSPDTASADANAGPLIGPLTELELRAERLILGRALMQDVLFKAARAGTASGLWQATVNARQAQGKLTWDEAADGQPGHLKAHMDRLSIEASDKPTRDEDGMRVADRAADDLSSIPAIAVQVDDLTVYGHPLGALVLSGTNVDQGRTWRLDTLTLTNPAAELLASGFWTARGENRGLNADVDLVVHDAGDLLARLGRPGVVEGGRGTISGPVRWRDSPWHHRLEDVGGELDIAITRGRFTHIQSATARLLEVVSLQSLERILRLKADPATAFRDGFPFDRIDGDVRVEAGAVQVHALDVESPVAKVSLRGNTHLTTQQWDMRAEVVPNLDLSGAALAAGLVLNPLVGVGALLSQWILKTPLQAAFTQRYSISGPWDDPKVDPLKN